MDPGTLFSDIGHLKEIGIEASRAAGIPIGGLMHSWGARRYYDPVNTQIFNIGLNPVLTGVRTHILIVSGNGHMGKGSSKGCDLLNIDRGCNVDSAMADINADFHALTT